MEALASVNGQVHDLHEAVMTYSVYITHAAHVCAFISTIVDVYNAESPFL